MFLKGDIAVHFGKEYIILDIDYKKKRFEIGIPDPDNVTRKRKWVDMGAVQEQVKES